MRHATMNNPARTIAPPTPTTTPMTVRLVDEDMPWDLDAEESESDAGLVEDEEGRDEVVL